MDIENQQKKRALSVEDFQGSTRGREDYLIPESLEVKDLYEHLVLAQSSALEQYDEASNFDEIHAEVDSNSELMSEVEIFDFSESSPNRKNIEVSNGIDVEQLLPKDEPINPTFDPQLSEEVEPFQIPSESEQDLGSKDDGSMDSELLRIFKIIEEEIDQGIDTPSSNLHKEDDVEFKFAGTDEENVPPVIHKTPKVVSESKYSDNRSFGPNKTNQDKFIALNTAVTAFVIMAAGLVGLAFYTHELQSKINVQNSNNAASKDLATTSEIQKRIGILVTEVSKLNSAVFHFHGKGSDSSDILGTKQTSSELNSQKRPVSTVPQKRWTVKLVSVGNKKAADQLQVEFRSKGIPAEQQRIEIDGKRIYRIAVSGFSTRGQANDYGQKVIKELGIDGYWVSQ